jgi:hypothetical protein
MYYNNHDFDEQAKNLRLLGAEAATSHIAEELQGRQHFWKGMKLDFPASRWMLPC